MKNNKQNCKHRYRLFVDPSYFAVLLQCVYCKQIIERKDDEDFFNYAIWCFEQKQKNKTK